VSWSRFRGGGKKLSQFYLFLEGGGFGGNFPFVCCFGFAGGLGGCFPL
jgi:hypothetical protein